MFQRIVAFGVASFFGGARRGQPLLTALGAAISIWGLFKRLDRKDKPIYTRTLKDGEMVRIKSFRADAPPQDEL